MTQKTLKLARKLVKEESGGFCKEGLSDLLRVFHHHLSAPDALTCAAAALKEYRTRKI